MKPARIFIISAAATSLSACAFLQGEEPLIASQNSSAPQQQTAAADTPVAVSEQLVRNVQTQLDAKGIDAGPVDGIWGPRTQQGVQQFQQAQGLESTGELNAATLAALGIVEQQTASGGQAREQSASAGASAQTDQARPEFRNLDANEDQYVTLAEAAADTRISRDFKRADENNDMKLSREEFQRAIELQRPR